MRFGTNEFDYSADIKKKLIKNEKFTTNKTNLKS